VPEEFLRVSFTLDGAEHPANNHTTIATAQQVKYLVAMFVDLGLPPRNFVPNLRPESSSRTFGRQTGFNYSSSMQGRKNKRTKPIYFIRQGRIEQDNAVPSKQVSHILRIQKECREYFK
jgi:hypothetical protein